MKESLRNVGAVCAAHAPKAGAYASHDPALMMGKHVKLGFPSQDGKIEHMWVLVKRVVDGVLVGELDNDPVLPMEYACGDLVEFQMGEIEQVYGA